MTFRLFSNDFNDGDFLPLTHVMNGMGHSGQNISPHLAWDGVPEGTKSFIVTLFDPDAPTGSGWWHWIVANIPSSTTELAQGAGSGVVTLPTGCFQTLNDAGNANYGGAAPPPGQMHRYVFTVHALTVEQIPVGPNASGALVGLMAFMNGLAKATLTAKYGDG